MLPVVECGMLWYKKGADKYFSADEEMCGRILAGEEIRRRILAKQTSAQTNKYTDYRQTNVRRINAWTKKCECEDEY